MTPEPNFQSSTIARSPSRPIRSAEPNTPGSFLPKSTFCSTAYSIVVLISSSAASAGSSLAVTRSSVSSTSPYFVPRNTSGCRSSIKQLAMTS